MTNAAREMSHHISLGQGGETAAANYLRNMGYQILDRNWRAGKLELDIICAQNGYIVFVEVKTRSSNSRGGGAAAITPPKIRRLCKAAQIWLELKNCWDKPCRFDVICLTGAGDTFKVEHYPNAFEAIQALDCGYAHRQSW